jgi:N-acetylglucosaminyl-diphospho-decaprenol L-rhamnosyltransferase
MPSAPDVPGAGVCVVVVLHNSSETLADCLASIPRDAEAIVVDNASTDDGAALAERLLPGATVVRSERNLGFGGGCNLGLRETTAEVVVFLNPDAVLTAGAVDRLVGALDEEGVGMAGPAIITPTGAVEHTCRRWTTAWHPLIEHLPFSHRWSPARLRRDLPPESEIYRRGGRVAYVQGACMALRADTLRAIGGFDEDFFLYGEEESIALRLRALRKFCVYVPEAQAVHVGGTSTRHIGTRQSFHLWRSNALLLRKRGSPARAGLDLLVTIGALAFAFPAAAARTLLQRPGGLQLGSWLAAVEGAFSGARAPISSAPHYR